MSSSIYSFSRREVAALYGVPAHMLGSRERVAAEEARQTKELAKHIAEQLDKAFGIQHDIAQKRPSAMTATG